MNVNDLRSLERGQKLVILFYIFSFIYLQTRRLAKLDFRFTTNSPRDTLRYFVKGLLHCFSICIEIAGNNWYCFNLKNV